MSDNYEQKYTKPDLRRQLKQAIQDSDRGGAPGEWSARKSQLLVQEYEKHGGGYKQDEEHKDEAARSLEAWTAQNWQTIEGEGDARRKDKTKRYLPKEVWQRLSEAEKEEAEKTKERASQKGKQYVDWTPAIQRAMQEVGYTSDDSPDQGQQSQPDEISKEELYNRARDLDIEGRSQMDKNELKAAVSDAKEEQLERQTKEELYARARDLNISGRSQMNKGELIKALEEEEMAN